MAYTATEEQISSWKQQYKEIFLVKFEEYACYLKKPSRKTLSYASTIIQSNPIKSNEIILNDCWLAGDEIIKEDDSLFLSVSEKLAKLIEVKESELVKL